MFRRHNTLPDMPSGYPLDDNGRSFFSIVLPEATTNLVTNPSFELATTGYTAVGATLARSTTQQRRGAYSLSIAPTSGTSDGVYYAITLSASTVYTFSCDVYGAPGVAYKIMLADNTGAALNSYSFTGRGRWQRVSVSATTGAGTSYRLYLQKNGSASTATFYTDGWQCEQKAYPTTYCDGDLKGFVPTRADYLWTGTAHGSTSTRSAQCRAGGRVKNLSDFGFLVLACLGLSMAPVSSAATPSGLLGGAYYQRTITSVRDFSIGGEFRSHSAQQLDRDRADLENALRHDLVDPGQPLVLRYQRTECGEEIGELLQILCHYRSGLEGNQSTSYNETASITFTAYLPLIQAEGDGGASLGYQTSVSNANDILQRSSGGVWSAMGTGANGTAYALAVGSDGSIYAGGSFTSMGGVANTQGIAKWSNGAWSALGTGMNGDVRALAVGPDGSLYAAGAFTLAGGVVDTVRIAKWNGSVWSKLGTGLTGGTAYALAFGLDGSLYAAGDFTLASGVAGTVRIAKWNGTSWSPLSTGINGPVYALAVTPSGTLYAGGAFTVAGGVLLENIASWNGSAWAQLGTLTGDNISITDVYALAVGGDGTLYAGGTMTTASPSTQGVASWNGTIWSPLGSGVTGGDVNALAFDSAGALYAGGGFTAAGGVSVPGGLARYSGGSWLPVDIPSTPITALLFAGGALTVGGAFSGTATVEAVTSVSVTGSADAVPIITFTGPGRLYQLTNWTTGKSISFNLTLQSGETATLDLTPGNISFVSSFRGDISSTIMAGSMVSTWRLQAGTNAIGLYIAGTTDANTAAAMRWRPQYRSLNGGTP